MSSSFSNSCPDWNTATIISSNNSTTAITSICRVLCFRQCPTCFAPINWSRLYNSPGRRALFVSPFSTWENWGAEMLNKLPKVTQRATGRVWVWTQAATSTQKALGKHLLHKWILPWTTCQAICFALHLGGLVFNHTAFSPLPRRTIPSLCHSVPLPMLFLLPAMP